MKIPKISERDLKAKAASKLKKAAGIEEPPALDRNKDQTSVQESINQTLDNHGSALGKYTELINNVSRTTGSGSHQERFQDVFYGLNRLPQVAELPIHKEMQGMILFTRPDLNLSYDNISKVRQLSHLLTQDANSAMGAVKLALDPTTQHGYPILSRVFGKQRGPAVKSALTDMYNPYLSLLSNACVSMSPPPDLGISLYTSPEGVFREQWIMNDSIAENHGYYDLTCTFNNIKGNSVLMMLLSWVLYMGLLRIGRVSPHPHSRITNRMDYFTRIERFKFDESGRFIEQWFHTGASLPKSISVGAGFGLNKLEPYEYENKDISVQFGSVGAVYNDPIQLWEFNWRMMRWNTNLMDTVRAKHFYKAPKVDDTITNWLGYPLINLATREMEWWIPKEDYKRILKGVYDVDSYTAHLEQLTSQNKSRYAPMRGPRN